MSLGRYAVLSTLLFCGVVLQAWITREQFYPTVVYLSTSKIALMVLVNMALVVGLLLAQWVIWIVFGQLRLQEADELHENVRYAITETCFALTMFREEFTLAFTFQLGVLICFKSFHWLARTRIAYLPTVAVDHDPLGRVRVFLFTLSLWVFDCWMVVRCLSHLLEHGPSITMLLSFEYVLLSTTALLGLFHVSLLFIDALGENLKQSIRYWGDFLGDVIKLLTYMAFFISIMQYYGLPIHAIRDLWQTIKSLNKKVAEIRRYRDVVANLDERIADATPEELEHADRTCVICHEDMFTAKKLPCGHFLHKECLLQNLLSSPDCPTCRHPVLAAPPQRRPAQPQAPAVQRPPPAPVAAAPAQPAAAPVARALGAPQPFVARTPPSPHFAAREPPRMPADATDGDALGTAMLQALADLQTQSDLLRDQILHLQEQFLLYHSSRTAPPLARAQSPAASSSAAAPPAPVPGVVEGAKSIAVTGSEGSDTPATAEIEARRARAAAAAAAFAVASTRVAPQSPDIGRSAAPVIQPSASQATSAGPASAPAEPAADGDQSPSLDQIRQRRLQKLASPQTPSQSGPTLAQEEK
eukprot:TRINITY_DN2374_c0_g1_i1.p1 TRINITY_DN2374_c0_g1~~TRINITY_DN2374_c0_g1_i1.p1  ORF type:complete len:585 (-),score=123.72 TRINITY_DN2374_c0_g1_i1:27-1781(-)